MNSPPESMMSSFPPVPDKLRNSLQYQDGQICNSCNMGMGDLPDMCTLSPRAEGIYIRQITNAHVTSNMYHLWSMGKLIAPPFKTENHNQILKAFIIP